MSSPRLDFCCPACGENSVLVLDIEFSLSPGSNEFICPICKTKFDVSIEFKEVNSTEEE